MKRWVLIAGLLTVLWMLLQGTFTSLESVVGGAIAGLILGFIAIFPFRRMYAQETDAVSFLRRVPLFFVYMVIFLKDVLIANIQVARIVVSPSLPIDPRVVEIPLRVESDLAITTIANSITLTPGTLTMDYNEEKNALYVHSISGADIVEPIRVWEDYALRIFEGDNT
ncbi:MAG: Na+/H+ antiporter subunit E [Halobacteria archaeon]|nr:Na+/H+ antiporter subunit E [Halobacteria archaeon]